MTQDSNISQADLLQIALYDFINADKEQRRFVGRQPSAWRQLNGFVIRAQADEFERPHLEVFTEEAVLRAYQAAQKEFCEGLYDTFADALFENQPRED